MDTKPNELLTKDELMDKLDNLLIEGAELRNAFEIAYEKAKGSCDMRDFRKAHEILGKFVANLEERGRVRKEYHIRSMRGE